MTCIGRKQQRRNVGTLTAGATTGMDWKEGKTMETYDQDGNDPESEKDTDDRDVRNLLHLL